MSEMKTLNGYEIVDAKARDEIDTLKTQAQNTDEVVAALESRVDALEVEVESLKASNNGANVVEMTDSYDSRTTADGLSILDGHEAKILKIEGNVLALEEFIFSPTITGLTSRKADSSESDAVVLSEKYTLRKIENGENSIVDEIDLEAGKVIKRIAEVDLFDLNLEILHIESSDEWNALAECRAKLPERVIQRDGIGNEILTESLFQSTNALKYGSDSGGIISQGSVSVKGAYLYLTVDGGWAGIPQSVIEGDVNSVIRNNFSTPFGEVSIYYEMSEPEITDIDVDGSYTAYRGGTETVEGNDYANYDLGYGGEPFSVCPTLTQQYYLSAEG